MAKRGFWSIETGLKTPEGGIFFFLFLKLKQFSLNNKNVYTFNYTEKINIHLFIPATSTCRSGTFVDNN